MSDTTQGKGPDYRQPIVFPKQGKPVGRTTFFATGFGPADWGRIVGVLYKDGSTTKYEGVTIRQPSASASWVVHFSVPDAETHSNYTLRIHQKTSSGPVLAERPKIKFKFPWGVPVGSPGNGEDCCSDYFFAMGSLTGADTDISNPTMTRSGQDPVESNQRILVDPDWFADWPVLDQPYDYTLEVYGNGGGQGTVTNLHLATGNCS